MARPKASPYKSVDDFEKELISFANKYRIIVAEHSRRISSYFEMSCYNMIIRYYELNGYKAYSKNLISNRFRFKCSPSGLLKNFSYMELSKGNKIFRIYHNASVQSAYDTGVYTTPDIVVSEDSDPSITTDYYNSKRKFSYLSNKQMITFCEAKHIMPFPELMISFIGTVNELMPLCLKTNRRRRKETIHIAPSLMISGCLSKPTERIAQSLQRRYYINVLGDLFVEPYSKVFSTTGLQHISTLTSKGIETE